MEEGSPGGRQLRRRRREVDGRAVDHVRVAPVTAPVEEGVAGQDQEAAEPADDPDHRVQLAGELELAGPLRRRHRVDPRERHEDGIAELLLAEAGQHLLLEDLLALVVRQVERPEPRRRVELDLAADASPGVRVDVHEDRQAVVEARAADAPLVDQRDRVLLGRRRRRAGLGLGVDDDLRPGAFLDPVDRRLRCGDRRRVEEAGGVVDGPADDGIGEGRTGRHIRPRRDDGCQPGEDGEERREGQAEPPHASDPSVPRRRASVSAPSASTITSAGRGRPL